MRISLHVVDCDVDRSKVRNLLDNWSNVIDTNLAIFITLEEQKLACLWVIVRVNGCNWHLFLDAHIVQFGHEMLMLRMGLVGRRWFHDPDSQGATRVCSKQ